MGIFICRGGAKQEQMYYMELVSKKGNLKELSELTGLSATGCTVL